MKANSAASGPTSRSARADACAEVERRVIAREQQVIAVVDHHVELRIVIRAAAPARLARRLVHDHALAGGREPDRGGKAGEPGTDDMDRARHQMIA